MEATATRTEITMTAPICCGRPMEPEYGFVTQRLFHRCPDCRHTDYGWWGTQTTKGLKS